MLANYECDLHGHTNRSDGNDSPVEYIRHAVHSRCEDFGNNRP